MDFKITHAEFRNVEYFKNIHLEELKISGDELGSGVIFSGETQITLERRHFNLIINYEIFDYHKNALAHLIITFHRNAGSSDEIIIKKGYRIFKSLIKEFAN